jgi:beta-glucosidase
VILAPKWRFKARTVGVSMELRCIRLGLKIILGLVPLWSGAVQAADPASPAQSAATIHPALWPEQPAALPADPALEARIGHYLSEMTLEQKVGQLIQADIGSITPDELRHYPLGSILNGGSSSPGNNEFSPPSEWLALADRFYDASMDPAHGPRPIPTLWGTDAVHGHNNLVGATIFPHNIGLGAARDRELIRSIGEATAREVRATGMEWTFAPTLAVVRDDRWGRTYESYSEDPQIVREYAGEMVTGLQGKPGTAQFLDAAHVLATAKHYMGDGGTRGHDQGDNRASETELRDIHFPGYPPALAAGVQTVMASFSSWQGVKMHGNRALLTDVLKQRLHFDGLVVGDWNGHGQIPGCTNVSCAAAINAGLDVIMAPDSWKQLYANTLAQVQSGEIPIARIEDADRRILRVKLRAHLFDLGRPSSRLLSGHDDELGSPAHRALARRAVRESLVLIKNQKHVLPLNPHQHVGVAGDGANSIARQSGGWTITWQGTGVSNANFPHSETIYAGIQAATAAAGGTAELNESGQFQTRPDVAIVVFGETPYAEFQGDIGTVEYSPGNHANLQLLRKLRESRIPVVAIFLSGRPLWVNPYINAADAFVAAWLPGTEGGGIADVIFKGANGVVAHDFRGKLSFSWPATPEQSAVNRGDGNRPLFPYGYGLRYPDEGDLAKLPENGGSTGSATTDTRVFFTAGKPGSGWHWMIDTTEVAGGVGVVGGIRMSAIDRAAQEDARQITWGAAGAGVTSVALSTTTPINLQRETNGQLSLGFDYKIARSPTANVTARMACGPGCRGSVDLTKALSSAPVGAWTHLRVPLSCFAGAGVHMDNITAPFEITSAGAFELSITNIQLETGSDSLLSCPAGG